MAAVLWYRKPLAYLRHCEVSAIASQSGHDFVCPFRDGLSEVNVTSTGTS